MEFNLSKKLTPIGMIYEEDVREFVRLLKLEMELTWRNIEILDKLAGEKLV